MDDCTIRMVFVAIISPFALWGAWVAGKCILVELVGWAFEQLVGSPQQYLHRGYLDNIREIVKGECSHSVAWHCLERNHLDVSDVEKIIKSPRKKEK